MKRAHFLSALLLLVSATSLAQPKKPDFSVERGFHETPFQLEITSEDPETTIRYTLDGSVPTPSTGFQLEEWLAISTTAVVRAIAVSTDGEPSEVETHTYVFVDDVLKQPKEIEGWKADRYWAGGREYVDHDYEMDPEIVNSPLYSEEVRDALLAIPTMSLSMDRDAFWEVYDGDVERPVSVEVLYPEQPEANHSGLGGLVAHSHDRLKRSLRLSFRSDYGDGKFDTDLFTRAVLNGESAVSRFDRIVLRGGNNRSWARVWNDGRAAYTRDQWYRDTQIAMSGIGARGVFVHLYINGLYWGLYNPIERPDNWHASAYFGGDREDWYSISHGGSHGGDPTRWTQFTGSLMGKDLSIPENYEAIKEYLDVEKFADYVMLTWYTRMTDWPKNNWWAAIRSQPPGQAMFFGWDNEWSWYETGRYEDGGAWVHPDFESDKSSTNANALGLWHALRRNIDFMSMFADRVYKQCFNGGPLSDEKSRTRWQLLNDHVRTPIVAESARWGDAIEEHGHPTRTRDVDWQNEVDRVDALMNGNADRFFAALNREGYFPATLPPAFSPQGGVINSSTDLQLSNNNPFGSGDIYYTTDGSDPRADGGSIATTAVPGGNGVTVSIDQTMHVRARILAGTTWSPIEEAFYVFADGYESLLVTELMYHPPPNGDTNPDDYEFMELMNAGSSATDLSRVTFSDGIGFTFGTPTLLEPGAFLVIASDSVHFRERYGFAPYGQYAGRLANEGERIALEGAYGEVLWEVTYDDVDPWPEIADGGGHSLVLRNPQDHPDPAIVANWRPSLSLGGSPGAEDLASTSIEESPLTKQFFVGDPYPNPGTSRVFVPVRMEKSGTVQLELFDALGRRIESTRNADLAPGRENRIELHVGHLPAGMYFLHLSSGGKVAVRPLTLLH